MKFNSYVNGNYTVVIYEDGTKVRFTKDDEFKPAFNEACDVSITDKCHNLCDFCYQGCTPKGKEADLFSYNFINTLHPFTEVALNGNNLDHPQLLDFLKFLKSKDVIANITVHQNDFMKNIKMLKSWENQGLFKGLGISLSTPTKELIEAIKEFPNAVIHTINGFLTKELLESLADKNLKILILGYKDIGRGKLYKRKNNNDIDAKIEWLRENLRFYTKRFNVISFDNLCLTQINLNKTTIDMFLSDKPEEWRDIKGYEGLYQISNFGRVKSLRFYAGSKYIDREKILKSTTISDAGYQSIQLQKNKKGKRFLVHRLVAQAFIPNPNNLSQINHKDENVYNNYIDNLEWCASSYNLNYGNHSRNMANTLSYKINQFTLEGELVKSWNNINEVATEFGCCPDFIRDLCKNGTTRKIYRHKFDEIYNYDWKYEKKDPKIRTNKSKWDKFYMGDDGQFTFFIDMVKNEFAKDSLSQERFPIDNKTIDEMFNFIKEKYGKNND